MSHRTAFFAALCLAAAGAALTSTEALGGNDDEFMNLDLDGDGRGDGKKSDASQWTWPRHSRFDFTAQELSMRWPGRSVDEVLPFDDIIRFERSRPYEEYPDELFILLADGRRVLVSRGDDVNTHTVLVTSTTGLPAVELEPGSGHFPVAQVNQLPPELRMGPGEGVRYVAAKTTDLAIRNRRGGGEMVKVAEDNHPALRDEGGGVLEKHEVELVLKQRMSLFMRCYQRELQRDPGLKGTVVVRFVIDRDGSVKHAHLRATSLGNPVVEECVVDEVNDTRFPRPSGGTVVVSYPFNFQPL
jgi:TonB family protein